jgi:hypothetical protein
MVPPVPPRTALAMAAVLATASAGACVSFQNLGRSIAEVAPASMSPLVPPRQALKGGKGDADAPYPPDFAATVKPDGTVLFPQHTPGRLQGSSLLVGGEPVVTVAEDGSLKGSGLKHKYKFALDGALLDDSGHGVRIFPDGTVRAVGGAWTYRSVFAWTPEAGGDWDDTGWRAVEIVALVVVENMLPSAIRPADGGAGDGGSKAFELHIPPPSQWFK